MAATIESRRRPSAKGLRRRQHLLDAAATVLLRDGPSGVSHRAVAAEADLPLAATTYYFDSLEELVASGMRQLADSWLAAARSVVDARPARLTSPDGVADAVLAVLTTTPDGAANAAEALLSCYERYLQAGRHAALGPLVRQWNAEVEMLLAEVLRRGGIRRPEVAAPAVLALADGALIRALSEGREVASVASVVAAYLAAGHDASGGSVSGAVDR